MRVRNSKLNFAYSVVFNYLQYNTLRKICQGFERFCEYFSCFGNTVFFVFSVQVLIRHHGREELQFLIRFCSAHNFNHNLHCQTEPIDKGLARKNFIDGFNALIYFCVPILSHKLWYSVFTTKLRSNVK